VWRGICDAQLPFVLKWRTLLSLIRLKVCNLYNVLFGCAEFGAVTIAKATQEPGN
jgi:hypothetical protein